MATTISQELALLITGKATDFVAAASQASKSSEELAVSQAKADASALKLQASTDRLAVSESKLALAQAKTSGDTTGIASAQTALAAAQDKAAVSKATAAAAADKLSVAELQAKAATSGLGQETSKTGGLFGSLLGESGGLTTALEGLTAGAALAGTALAFKTVADGIGQFETLGDQLHQTQLLTGGTATQVSLLVGQMKELGIDPDTAAKALARLGASIGDGSTKLGQFGIQVALNHDGTVNLIGTLDNLRQAYNNSADASTRDAIAKQLGLRSAQELVPLLALTNQQVQQFNAATQASGQVFTEADIQRAHDLTVSSQQLKQAWDGFEITLAQGVVPALETIVRDATPAISVLDRAAKGLDKILAPFQAGAVAVEHLTGSTNQLKGAQDSATSSAAAQAAANQNVTDAVNAQADAEDKLTSALTGQMSAQRAMTDSAQQITDAQQREVDAQSSLNKLLADGPVNASQVVSAQSALASASDQVTRAAEQESKAQDNLNKARQAASAIDLADAQNKIALAGDKISSAQAAEGQAQEALDALLGSGSASASEIAAAQADLKTKHDEVTQAMIDQGKAQQDLTTVQQKGTDADPAVQQAEDALASAHQSLTDSVNRRADAEAKLRQAEQPDPDFANKVADAQNALADAHNAVATAQDGQVKAALDLQKATDTLNASLDGNAQAVASIRSELEKLNSQGINTSSLLGLLDSLTHPTGAPSGSALQQILTGPLGGDSVAAQPSTGGAALSSILGPVAGARASGGPTDAGGTYLVGENGPELLHMGPSSGFVQPNAAAQPAGPLVAQTFYGYPTDIIGAVAAREAALSIHSVAPAYVRTGS